MSEARVEHKREWPSHHIHNKHLDLSSNLKLMNSGMVRCLILWVNVIMIYGIMGLRL